MCGRFTLTSSASELSALFDGLRFAAFPPRYNICPTQPAISVRSRDSHKEVVPLRWGLVPAWSKDLKIGARMINARSETVAVKPAFRSAFKSQRCLIIANGFYEWKKEGRVKQPHYISRINEHPFCMAGLWESWTDPSISKAKPVESCTVLTTAANEIMKPLHDRMPVILAQKNFDLWLDPNSNDREHLESLLVPCDSSELRTYPVDTIVNKAANDIPECIEPLKFLF